MEKNVILAGVGGQGILSIAYVIDNAALDAGYHFKQAEVHGMAQRGGAVQSNLRYADHPIHSDLIPKGKAHLILSVEPLEAMRYREYLAEDGWIVTSTTPYVNIPDYPDHEKLLGKLAGLERVVMVDSKRLASAAGNLRAQNMIMVGAAAPLLDFQDDQLVTHVRALFARKGEKIQDVNERAFHLGKAAGLFFRGLVDGGMAAPEALALCGRLQADTFAAGDPKAFVEAQATGGLEALIEAQGTEKRAS